MRRRDFLSVLCGSTASWPIMAQSQQPAMPSIGFLGSESLQRTAGLLASFHRGLREFGFVEGENVTVEYRWAEGHNDRLPALAADLVNQGVNVIAVPATTPGALAVQAATSTVPIVTFTAGDPVALGLVASLSRPGGNITGTTSLAGELVAKRLELMREVIPEARLMALLINPTNPALMSTTTREAIATAHLFGIELHVLHAQTNQEFESIFKRIKDIRARSLIIAVDSFFTSRRVQLGELALRHQIPAIYQSRDFAEAGGLLSYGGSLADGFHLVGRYTGRVLRGEKPADLPVVQIAKIELIVNLKVANFLGLRISDAFIARADEIID